MNFQFMRLTVSIPVLSNTMRIVFSPSDGTFSIAVRDVCAAVGRDVGLEYRRIAKRFGPLSQLSHLGHRGPDGAMNNDYLLPVRKLENWLASMPLPPMTTGVHLLRAYRRTLYGQIWTALAQVMWRKRRLKWTEISEPDADGNVICTDEQIGAEHGVSPEVVRSIAARSALNGKTEVVTWN